ncbi:MAG: tetratricopeptide repeat protein [Anaerolineae bacterium]
MRKTFGLAILLLVLVTACDAEPAPELQATPSSINTPAAVVSDPIADPTVAAPAAPTITPSPTSTPLPTATPTVTPRPEARLIQAAQAVHDGDYDTAIANYQTVRDASSSAAQQETAAIELALTQMRATQLTDAIASFQRFIDQYPKSERLADAWFGLGEIYFQQENWPKAIEAYQHYLKLRGNLIAGYVQERIGDAASQNGDLDLAATAYQAAVDNATTASNLAGLREKLALTYRLLKNYAAALAQYDQILSFAQQPAYRAQVLYQAGQTLIDSGQTDAGYQRFIDLINTYPDRNDAYQALLTLVNAQVTVNEFQRGLVDYYAKQYDAAIAAFERFIDAQADHGNAHYYIGLSYKDAGNIKAALKAFDEVINQHPEASRWGDAWIAKAEAQWTGGDLEGALKTATTFVTKHPTDTLAATALWNAAGYLERNGDYARAVDYNVQLQAKYPNDDNASEALFDAGLDAYRVDKPTVAISAWQTLSDTYPLSQLYEAAIFWQGKTWLKTDRAKAEALFSQASNNSLDYFALRAGDLLSNTTNLPFVPSRLDIDPDEGRAEAEQWLSNWLSVPLTALKGLPDRVTSSASFQRGQEYWHLGKTAPARDEFIALRSAFDDDAIAQYTLAIYYRDIGLYYPSITAAARLIRMSPAGSIENAPTFLARLVYPIYYANLVVPEANARQIDPLVIFSLIRQESLFEGIATSSAYANGLMQIIPATGGQIASDLRWPNYQVSDLYRPLVSVKFGVYYLRRYGLDYLDGDIIAAWAAYNGGPGNARQWKDAAHGDVDLFVENISLAETRLYIERLRENLAMYQRLYGQ